MRTARALYHLARADVLNRVRRPIYLLLPTSALLLLYRLTDRGVRLSGEWEGAIFNTAWCALVLQVCGCGLLSCVGFYVVRGAVDRDRQTRVGALVATLPVSRLTYLLGKWLSSMALLAVPVVVLAVGAFVLQAARRESPSMEFWPVASLCLFVALPVLLVTSAVALCFDCVPVLSGGLGNIGYFLLWVFFFDRAMETGNPRWDLLGVSAVRASISASARVPPTGPATRTAADAWGASLGQGQTLHRFVWPGLTWSRDLAAQRLFWVGVAMGLIAVATVFFDRFDPARSRPARRGSLAPLAERVDWIRIPALGLPAPAFWNRFATVLAAEVKLLLCGHRWWWYTGAVGLWIASLCLPPARGRTTLLPVLWFWPVFAWSALGTRECRCGTGEVIFTAPAWRRQLPAAYLAGVLVAAVMGGGVALRTVLVGDAAGVLAWSVSALLIPAAALMLGIVTGSPRAFECLFTAAWYAGPFQHTRGVLNFMWASPDPAYHYAPWYFGLVILLLCVAWIVHGRGR